MNRRGQFYLLRAALAVGGRALTLWERVTPANECNAPQHEQALLRALKLMMPVGATPVLVTDAGFKSPWFKAVSAMGWQFVGRLRGSVLVKPVEAVDKPDQWVQCKHLHALSRQKAKELGKFEIARSRPTVCRMIVHATPPKGRVHRTLQGKRCRARYSRKIAQRHSEPWLLAVSLRNASIALRQSVQKFSVVLPPRLWAVASVAGSRSEFQCFASALAS